MYSCHTHFISLEGDTLKCNGWNCILYASDLKHTEAAKSSLWSLWSKIYGEWIKTTFVWCCPSGVINENVNPYILTHTPEEYWSDHMQTPGWRPTSCVTWLIWLFASLKKYGHTRHRMSLLRPDVIKQHKTKLCMVLMKVKGLINTCQGGELGRKMESGIVRSPHPHTWKLSDPLLS